MATRQQREIYLAKTARGLLRGQSSFNIHRCDLVEASGISRGTIYNHFPSEEALMVAVANEELRECLANLEVLNRVDVPPLFRFIMHHYWYLYDMQQQKKFAAAKLMVNEEILASACPSTTKDYRKLRHEYDQWNLAQLAGFDLNHGYNRVELLTNYLLGCRINCVDYPRPLDNAKAFEQFGYAIAQLLACANRPLPKWSDFEAFVEQWREPAKAA
ncbi:TetR/AcrR family transcriptional regulator [Paraferrimonas sedimenticola]|uniref:HTH tetR-type domain-containing protein n=1 Tax=Paraferrimonas sedimenticola TaxID=375674 RepID=A0AA37RUL4_9GAMM|nr:TetR/AcrR family transcriptional regulator [Paraferrimonas sedimenticola]GLP95463.1 hypothetical protein GCM10007895_07690 [Paraferrimonas sedimenticola]